MSYSRRDVLRDAALVSAGCSFCMLEGCKAPVTTFVTGIRIFFEGSWLFCANPGSDPAHPTMCAVTVDMVGKGHNFPYGLWHTPWSDADQPQLSVYNLSDPSIVTLGSNPSSQCSVDLLFANAMGISPFTYLPNDKTKNLNIQWNTPSLRVVFLPLPTRIIPAAFRSDGQVDDPSGHCHKIPASCQNLGVATTHIFDYQGADLMSFSPDLSTVQQPIKQANDSRAHYHFHTAPKRDYGPAHAACMFDALLQLITNLPHKDLSLITASDNPAIVIGPNVPTCVQPSEFEIPTKMTSKGTVTQVRVREDSLGRLQPFDATIPTCGGGGGGVGDCCD